MSVTLNSLARGLAADRVAAALARAGICAAFFDVDVLGARRRDGRTANPGCAACAIPRGPRRASASRR